MNIQVVNPVTHTGWDDLILARPDCSFFHSSGWARVLSDSYGFKPLYFTMLDGSALSACLPIMEVRSLITGNRGVSLPFTDSCDTLVDSPQHFDVLFARAKEFGKEAGWKYVELRGNTTFLNGTMPSISYCGHTVDLTIGDARLFASLRDSTRRNVRKAERQGVETKISNKIEAVEAFCKLNRITRKQHGLPSQPWRFFRYVHEHVLSKHLGFVALALYRGEPVAAALFFCFGRKAVFKYGASTLEHRNIRANNLVMWKAIEHLVRCGAESLCLGRTDMHHAGLRQFKAGWAASEYTINYYRHDLERNRFIENQPPLNGFSKAVFSKLPIPALNAIGSLTYRHMG